MTVVGAILKVFHAFKNFVQKVGHTITRVMNTILVALAYIVAIGPTAIIIRLTGSDPLDKKWNPDDGRDSYWLPKESAPDSIERFTRQF